MIWFLSLHIIALLFWAAGILYIPVLLAGAAKSADEFERTPGNHDSIAHVVFTYIATPAALVAMAAGAIVVMLTDAVEFWLAAKLTLVTILVIIHGLLGMLITRAERQQYQDLRLLSRLSSVILILVMVGIVWLALSKPDAPEAFAWPL
ncbi:hypothetical protein IDSA_06960 [Pseudidiomarina salinarum]|uniref:Protoporphyrinogen IX oxidase n=1 Tax=Pseudidiomarina salinarum TaxID=435908 RepID=A0A094L7T2_9GAMM|nr:CopD family protein [Pseudidiomarina salinarum]KFZ30818.1 hypothetical protein IDSA_06960 [Pseudidiomarina salinarum]RUO71287.1 hypothetical protein CWI79_07645 [Pseudidiomarina salinarum]